MSAANDMPDSLLEAVTYFADEDRAHDFFVTMRWPDGVRCAHCGSENVGKFSGKRRVSNCKACKNQFTAKVGTVFNESPLLLFKWLPALWLVVNAKNGISSCELARALNITQKTAWFMGHRIRTAIQRGGGIVRCDGVFECDESAIGGLARNMHADKRAEKITGRGSFNKGIVMGPLARHNANNPTSKVVTKVLKTTKAKEMRKHIERNIPVGAEIHTDAFTGYRGLDPIWQHKVVDHAEAYAKDGVHTNGLENFWSLLKRTIKGTYVHCAPFHLFRYLDEQTFRFNERQDEKGDQGQFLNAVKTTTGRRLTWKKLTGQGTNGSLTQ
jgi:transposase-like protein